MVPGRGLSSPAESTTSSPAPSNHRTGCSRPGLGPSGFTPPRGRTVIPMVLSSRGRVLTRSHVFTRRSHCPPSPPSFTALRVSRWPERHGPSAGATASLATGLPVLTYGPGGQLALYQQEAGVPDPSTSLEHCYIWNAHSWKCECYFLEQTGAKMNLWYCCLFVAKYIKMQVSMFF